MVIRLKKCIVVLVIRWKICDRCLPLAPSGGDRWFAPRAVQTLSALCTTICCQCCRFAEQIQESLCDIFQSVHPSPLAACRNAWGGKSLLRSNIMPPVSKHYSATRCASQRCPLDKLLMLAAKTQTSLVFARNGAANSCSFKHRGQNNSLLTQ